MGSRRSGKDSGLIAIASVTCAALAASLLLSLAGRGSPVALAHLAFAVGVFPLILAAIAHFVPVLTRSGEPSRRVAALPALAQVSGLGVVAALEGLLPRWVLHPAVLVDVALALGLLFWAIERARRCLGAPHPGWRWYAAALGCGSAALAAVPFIVSGLATAELRLWHVHLNVLGLVGLAALGTLPVLLPTALGRPDPAAATWLRRRLWPVLGAVLAVAAGAALAWPLAAVGAAVLFAVVLGLLGHWLARFGLPALAGGGAASSLVVAVLGLLGGLALGTAHGMGVIAGRPAIAAWGAGFLLPLVTGALSQLLPVWRHPGPASPARAALARALARFGRLRALAFLGAGMALAAGWVQAGASLAATGLGLFLLAAVLPGPAAAR